MKRAILALLVCILYSTNVSADLVVNQAVPIIGQVCVQPIIVSNDDGSNTAEYFGNAVQQSFIEGFVDTIWAQAGLDIVFLNANTWDNSFANIGTPGLNNPRPTADLSAIVAAGDVAGVGNSDPLVIDMYFVEIAAGFPDTSENTANGLAFIGGNGITQHVGDNLVSFTAGQEVAATVVAHEIGHNLGLNHIVEAENLMQEGGSPDPGARLNAAQIATSINSQFVKAVPEPSSLMVLAFAGCVMSVRRRSKLV